MFKLAAIFSDNCVFQREKPVCVFGSGKEGARVRVTICAGKDVLGESEAQVKDGRWLVRLAPLPSAKGLTLTAFSEQETRTLQNIAVGEVWLCGGQSNMEFELQNCSSGPMHLHNDAPDVRFYYTQKKLLTDEDFLKSEENTGWAMFSPENARCWSAVGYIFAEKLSRALGVTVGLIGCNWGGTSASCWMDEAALREDKDTNSYIADYEKGIAGKSIEQQTREYREYQAFADEWNRRYGELIAEHPGMDWLEAEKILGHNKWPGPINYLSPFKPCALYHSMLMRVCPYTLRGFLFYQGESDDHKPHIYEKLFSRMIRAWREAWNDDAPFLYVQLPGHRYMTDPDYKHWCLIREAQQKVSDSVKDAAMICAIDAGEINEIHPKDKEPIGERLCRLAMEKVYGRLSPAEAESPRMESVRFEGAQAFVSFAAPCGALCVKGTGDIAGFELAGEEMRFKSAEATLLENGCTVRLCAKDVAHPKYVRYLWTNYPEVVNLYGINGLPVFPFRTDSADANTQKAQSIQQVMEL